MLKEIPGGTKIFVDSNILIYHFLGVSEACTDFLERVRIGDVEGYTSTIVLAEVLHRLMIAEAVEKYGLKKRNLNKFRKQVERFYEKVIVDKRYKSEVTLKYRKRFICYRQCLFTFLEHDTIPWNNNMAERSLRHLAVQRKISGAFHGFAITLDYLLLLGITQTCRFQNKSLLKFLLSGEKDIDHFIGPNRVNISRPIKR